MHLLHNAVPGEGWIKRGKRIEIKTNSGRNRLNILGAYSPDDGSLISIEGPESCDAEMVCKLLKELRKQNHGIKLMVVLDNASYNHAHIVKDLAKKLHIRLFYLPTYSPNLNIIERFWKFLKKKVVRNTYYSTFGEFRLAVKEFLRNIDAYSEELSTLMTEKFQMFASK